jgi:ferredoxin
MKVIITSNCVICRLCSEIAPEIFSYNDVIDIAEVIRNPQTEDENSRTQEAINSCPSNAIQKTE